MTATGSERATARRAFAVIARGLDDQSLSLNQDVNDVDHVGFASAGETLDFVATAKDAWLWDDERREYRRVDVTHYVIFRVDVDGRWHHPETHPVGRAPQDQGDEMAAMECLYCAQQLRSYDPQAWAEAPFHHSELPGYFCSARCAQEQLDVYGELEIALGEHRPFAPMIGEPPEDIRS